MESCQQIIIEIETNEIQLNPIVYSVGGVICSCIGILVGIFILKCNLQKSIKNCNTTSCYSTDLQRQSSKLDISPGDIARKSDHLNQRIRVKSSRQIFDGDDENFEEFYEKEENSGFSACFLEVLLLDSLIEAVQQQQSTIEQDLAILSVESWTDRHTVIMKIFKLILDNYFQNERINEAERQLVLRKAQMAYKSLTESCIFERENKKVIEESSKAGVECEALIKAQAYIDMIKSFEVDLLELVGFSDAPIIREVLVKCFKKVEENINAKQEYNEKVLMTSFCRDLLVFQAYHSGKMALNQLRRKCLHYLKMMIGRLVESDRLNEDEGKILWQRVKEEFRKSYEDIISDLEQSCTNMITQCRQQRKHANSSALLAKSKALERFTSDVSTFSPIQRINDYFSLSLEAQRRQHSVSQNLTKAEVHQVNELLKKVTSNLCSSFEEAQEQFCESLFTTGILNESETETVRIELIKKNKKVNDDIKTISQIQTRIIEREIKSLRTFQNDSLQDENKSSNLDLFEEMLKEDKACFTSHFLATQPYLHSEDRDAITHEFNVFCLMLENNRRLSEILKHFRLDVELIRKQIQTMLIEREEERLVSDEDVDMLVKKLAEQRNHFQVSRSTSFAQVAIESESFKKLQEEHLCLLVAESMVNNLFPGMKNLEKENEKLRLVKNKLSSKILLNDATMESVEEVKQGHELAVDQVESRMLQEYEAEAQILADRFNYQHLKKLQQFQAEVDGGPLNSSSLTSTDVLQRLLDQDRNKRLVESLKDSAEPELKSQTHLLRSEYHEKLQTELHNLDLKLLTELAKVLKMSRNAFIELIEEALATENEKERKKFLTSVMKNWNKNTNFTRLSGNAEIKVDLKSSTPELRPKPKKRRNIFQKKKVVFV